MNKPCNKFVQKSIDEWYAIPEKKRPHFASLAYCKECGWFKAAHPNETSWIRAIEPSVIELAMCEYLHLALKPNQLYKFVVHEDCSECVRMAKGE